MVQHQQQWICAVSVRSLQRTPTHTHAYTYSLSLSGQPHASHKRRSYLEGTDGDDNDKLDNRGAREESGSQCHDQVAQQHHRRVVVVAVLELLVQISVLLSRVIGSKGVRGKEGVRTPATRLWLV